MSKKYCAYFVDHTNRTYINLVQPIGTMKSGPFWAAATGDLPFVGMKDNACEFTQCPVAQNIDQTYDFQLKVSKSLPRVRIA